MLLVYAEIDIPVSFYKYSYKKAVILYYCKYLLLIYF